jgi:hypothetical protein
MINWDPSMHLPWDDEHEICAICGMDVSRDNCECPPCATCGGIGDPDCYAEGSPCGLNRSQEQIDSLAAAEKRWNDCCKDDWLGDEPPEGLEDYDDD